jgi:HSP20 family protein
MEVNVRNWIPWNWFKKEEEHEDIPVRRAGREALPSRRHDDPLDGIHREIDRLFSHLLQPLGAPWSIEGKLPSSRSSGYLLKPRVDIKETARAYVVTLEVPGVDESDVRVELNDRILIIRGEKKHEAGRDDETYHWVERSYGAFQRMLSLPDDVQDEAIEARFKHGVLTVTVPRSETARSDQRRVIEISRG